MPEPATAAPAPAEPTSFPWAVGGVLFVLSVLVAASTMLLGVQPNDEGLMLQAAARISSGEVPYRDFWWFYPPGQSYLLGGLWSLLGPSLLTWRIVRVLADGAVAVLAWRLTGRRAGPRGALVAWAVATLAMAYPSGPHPFPVALALGLGALLLLERHPLWSGALVGVAALWRIEFAAYIGAGVLVAYALRPGDRRERVTAAARFAATALGTAAVLFLPVVAAAGASPSWDLLVRYPVQDFSKYQSLPFPLRYDGPLNTGSVGGFLADSAENLLVFYLPLVLVAGLVAAVLVLVLRWDRRRDWAAAATIVTAIGMAHYLVIRPDVFHAAPLVVLLGVVGTWAISAARAERRVGPDRLGRRRVAVLAGGAVAVAALAFALVEGADRSVRLLTDDTVALTAPAADGVRAPAKVADPLNAVVADVRRRVPAGAPIYVLGQRADFATAGAPLVYVLADRPNPTRYDIAAPGVVTSAPVQREIIRDLRRTRPGAVVRWTDPVTAAPEPNLSGVSSGVRLLDAYLAAAYRPAARYGAWQVLVPRRP